jgi:hypothetical protein
MVKKTEERKDTTEIEMGNIRFAFSFCMSGEE